MPAEHFELLVGRLLDGRLNEAAAGALAAELLGSEETRRRFVRLVDQEAFLHVLAKANCAARAVPARKVETAPSARLAGTASRRYGSRARMQRRRFSFLPLAVAAVLLLAAGGIAFVLSRQTQPAPKSEIAQLPSAPHAVAGRAAQTPTAEIALIQGDAKLARGGAATTAAVGTALLPGDELATGDDGRLALRYADGTRIEMNSETMFSLGTNPADRAAKLDHGDIYVMAAGPIAINRGGFDEVSVLGTEFELSRSSVPTIVRVANGTVRFGMGTSAVSVSALQTSLAQPGAGPGAPEAVEIAAIAPWRNELTMALAGWWKFDEGNGNTAHDSSGNGNHGQISGAAWTEGRYGRGLLLDAEGKVEVPWSDSLAATKGVTVSAWVRAIEKPGKEIIELPYVGIGQDSDTRNYRFSIISTYSRGYCFYLSHAAENPEREEGKDTPSTSPTSARISDLIWPDGWTHVAFTVKAGGFGEYTAYVSGKPVRPVESGSIAPELSRPLASSPRLVPVRFERLLPLSDEPFLINSENGFRGAVDDVRVYRRALSADEVRRLAEGGAL